MVFYSCSVAGHLYGLPGGRTSTSGTHYPSSHDSLQGLVEDIKSDANPGIHDYLVCGWRNVSSEAPIFSIDIPRLKVGLNHTNRPNGCFAGLFFDTKNRPARLISLN